MSGSGGGPSVPASSGWHVACDTGPEKGTNQMTCSKHALTTVFLFAIATSAVGCATGSGAPRDLRSSARLPSAMPSLLVEGPALLLHVDVDDPDDELVIYAVSRKQGTSADCGAGPAGDSLRLRPRRANPVNLVVPADQTACVSSSKRRASIHWHARRPDGALTTDRAQMLALGAHDR
jgi:hypothetical protein